MERRDRPLAPQALTPPVLVLAGPTAVGKSSLALSIAEAVGGEIVSADSRQVYRGMDIGTAKPSAEEQARVPHHLIDILDPGEPYSAGRFLRDARAVIDRLHAGGTPAVVVGGSTLYVHALVRGLADLPDVPADLVAALTEAAGTASGRAALYDELHRADPEAAGTLDPTKSQRLARLVGVLRTASRPPSELWAEATVPPIPSHLVVLSRPRREVYAAIDQRVLEMVDAGLVDEVAALAALGQPVWDTLRKTIGYQEVLPVLDGTRTIDEATRLIQRNSRRYAKRQLTWYRRYDDAAWLDAERATASEVLNGLRWPERT